MKHTQNEPNSPSDLCQKKPVNAPLLNRSKIILMKQAMQRAELFITKQRGKARFDNIEGAISHIHIARRLTVQALQAGFISLAQLDEIEKEISSARRFMNPPEFYDVFMSIFELKGLIPPMPLQRGIPLYAVKKYPVSGGAK